MFSFTVNVIKYFVFWREGKKCSKLAVSSYTQVKLSSFGESTEFLIMLLSTTDNEAETKGKLYKRWKTVT